MKPPAMVTIAAVLLLTRAGHARADSDGYYCVGGGFLAAEFRSFNTPGLNAAHVLKVARLDTVRGARWTDEVIVEDFQTHVLTCGVRTILFEGAGEPGRGFVSYVIEIDSTGKARITRHSNDRAYRFGGPVPVEPPNLGDWAAPGTTSFPQIGGGWSFQLHVTQHDQRVSAAAIRHDVRSVLELVVDGRIRDSLVVHEGHRMESTDNHVGHASMTLRASRSAGSLSAENKTLMARQNVLHRLHERASR